MRVSCLGRRGVQHGASMKILGRGMPWHMPFQPYREPLGAQAGLWLVGLGRGGRRRRKASTCPLGMFRLSQALSFLALGPFRLALGPCRLDLASGSLARLGPDPFSSPALASVFLAFGFAKAGRCTIATRVLLQNFPHHLLHQQRHQQDFFHRLQLHSSGSAPFSPPYLRGAYGNRGKIPLGERRARGFRYLISIL